jgi:hypothetical protein
MLDRPANPDQSLQNGVPSFLEGPATSKTLPPVQTLAPTLPCEQLSWQDFERLCVRMARLDSDIEHSQLYGTPGQAQEGIDLFARSFTGEYAVYQCKRVESLTAADIRAAVEKFLAGSWAERAKKFILCTSLAAVRTEQAEEYNKQFELLSPRNIRFDIWDREQISTILKDQPRLVHDFFGKGWLIAFLGEGAARTFESRLDPSKVVEFRHKLAQFYASVLAVQDPGIPIPPQAGLQSIPLTDRFVPQDILIDERVYTAPPQQPRKDDQSGFEKVGTGEAAKQKGERPKPLNSATYRTRESLRAWLARSTNSVITGGPGSGKTTLLRAIALEILSDNPQQDRIARAWAERLPVWLPFAFWTKQIADFGACNVTEAVRRWLDFWNEADLWGLVERAMQDERLLLLVDGLDESANDEAGRTALQLLLAFVQTHKVSAVTTSRPLFASVVHGADWQQGELAGLSDAQKMALCTKWFDIRNQIEMQFGSAAATPELLAQETQSFLKELEESDDLEQLSRVPLLLSLLLYLRFQNAVLPRDRFEAYHKLVDYLLKQHPATKTTVFKASAGGAPLRDREIHAILAKIGLEVQILSSDGIISADQLAQIVERLLNDPNGLDLKLPPSELRQFSDQFVRRVLDASGIIVRQGINSVSFLHHSLQEYLAATQIASMPMSQVIEIIELHILDSRWREVILNTLWKLQRPAEVGQLIEKIESSVGPTHSGLYVRELLTEVACSAIGCPTDLARRIASEAVAQVEGHDWLPYRRRMVRHLLAGLNSTKTKEIVARAASRWAFRLGGWRAHWYEGFSEWSPHPHFFDALMVSLNDEDSFVQRAAAETLAQVAGGHKEIGDDLADLAHHALDPIRRAAALRALSLGWKDHPSLWMLIADAIQSRNPELQLTAVSAKVRLGQREDQDWKILVAHASADLWSRAPWGWSGEIVSSLAAGWQGSAGLKKLCLQSAEIGFRNREDLDPEIAQRVLLEAFPHDEDVAKYCANQIRTQRLPFPLIHFDAWKLVAKSFRDDPIVISAIDEWAPKQSFHDPELHYAALVGRTPVLKRKLLEDLSSSPVPFWGAGALIEGWGLGDAEVSAALISTVYGETARASGIARFIPQIVDDPKKARQRLMQLLSDPSSTFPHLILEGLSALSDRGNEKEIVRQALALRETKFVRFDGSFDSELILGFSTHPEIREFGLRQLASRNPPVSAMAKSYQHDTAIRQRLLDIIVSVPASLRSEVIDGLGRFSTDPELALTVLERYDTESNSEAKVRGAVAFHRLLMRHQRDLTAALGALSEAIRSYGIDHDARRQAALAGILVLNRLDLMDQEETIGSKRPVSVSAETHGELNLSLLRTIAEHWDQLRAKFGDKLKERISDQYSVTTFPEALAVVAAEFPEVQEEVWKTADPNVANSNSVLKLLATVKPKSEMLKLRCLNEIRKDDGTWGGIEHANFAAVVLGDTFSGDENVRIQITRGRPPFQFSEAEIIALCVGWSSDPVISEINQAFRTRKHIGVSMFGALSVLYASVAVEKFVEILLKDLDTPHFSNSRTYEALKGPVERRIKRDPQVRLEIHKVLRTGATPSGKATLPGLLARSEGLTVELHQWIEEELTRQMSSESIPQVGFNLINGTVSSVTLSLLDVLDS